MLHAAAWTDVDGAEDDPQEAAAVNVGGTAHVAALGAPLVSSRGTTSSTGPRLSRTSSRTSPQSALRTAGRSCTARRRGRARLDRADVVALRLDVAQLRAHDAPARTRAGRGRRRRRPARVSDLRRAPRRRVRDVVRLPAGCSTLAAAGDVGRARRGDLRGGRHRLPRPADHDRRVRRAGLRVRPTPCCAASAARRSSRTGARGCGPAWSGSPSRSRVRRPGGASAPRSRRRRRRRRRVELRPRAAADLRQASSTVRAPR